MTIVETVENAAKIATSFDKLEDVKPGELKSLVRAAILYQKGIKMLPRADKYESAENDALSARAHYRAARQSGDNLQATLALILLNSAQRRKNSLDKFKELAAKLA